MTRLTFNESDISLADETIRPLEWTAHTIWAEAKGLPQLLREAHPDEIEAVKNELIEAANMVLALMETKQ
jgi:hypothetical protein